MNAELLQFGIMLAGICAAVILWLKIVYLPRRTMECWEGHEAEARDASTGAAAEDSRAQVSPRGR